MLIFPLFISPSCALEIIPVFANRVDTFSILDGVFPNVKSKFYLDYFDYSLSVE